MEDTQTGEPKRRWRGMSANFRSTRKQVPVQITTRRCLKCRKNFDSEGIHNRLCGVCGRTNSTTPDDSGYLVAKTR